MPIRRGLFVAAVCAALVACGGETASVDDAADAGAGVEGGGPGEGSGDAAVDAAPRSSGPPFAEVEAALADYRGVAVVASEVVEDGVTTYEFDPASGPLCLRGAPYRFAVRGGTAEHDDLLIFLQGGGACWSALCLALETARSGIPGRMEIVDPELVSNPVRDWDVAFLPYCDGSFFSGDAAYDDDGDGALDRHHRGLRNLVAALEVTRARFPTPGRVVLAGSSGGGFGTITAAPIVRILYPDAELFVFNDAGVGIAKSETPAFVSELVDEFGGRRLVPPSCAGCLDSGHLTGLIEWTLERDPRLKVAAFSAYGDFIIANLFLRVGAEVFERDLRAETGRLHARFPDRYMPFLVEGTLHTTLIGAGAGFPDGLDGVVSFGGMDRTAVDGLTIAEWFTWMLDGDARWGPVLE